MARPRFGIALPGVQQIPGRSELWENEVGAAELVRAARAAESAGLAWVSCSDHPLVPASRVPVMGATWFDPCSTLAFVAAATARIAVLPHVLVAPYRHPLLVAKQWGTLARLAPGRVIVGVGSGHVKPEFTILGADYARRGLVTDEYLQVLAAAWEHEVVSFEGDMVRFRDVVVSPRPARRPPLWIGGNSGAAVRRAARFGDGWIPWELTHEEFSRRVERLRDLRAEAGRHDPVELVVPLGIAAETSAEAVVARVSRWCEAGATAFHVGVRAASIEHLLERLAWLGSDVLCPIDA
jgi:probable F420-dependent oxidoreductase